MARLSLLFQSVALATLSTGCFGGSTIDRSKFVDDVCETDGLHPFRKIKPAIAIDGAELHEGTSPKETFGSMCATAKDVPACRANVATASSSEVGWFAPSGGDVANRHFVITTTADEVRTLGTIAELKSLLGVIDTAEEAALLVTETTSHRIACGQKNVKSNQDGSFELLGETGTGCGDDIELHVVRVGRDGSVTVTERETLKEGNPNCAIGRRTEGLCELSLDGEDLGAFFAQMAHLEAAAVPAFERLARELAAHGAPRRLVLGAERAARDEVRHARAVEKLARRFGGTPAPAVVEERPIRSLETLARENATEGCVRETFGALIATYQARAARDPQIAKVMRGIARDETRHAELSWEIAEWAMNKLEARARTAIEQTRGEAIAALRRDLGTAACDAAIELAGFPTSAHALEMFDAIAPELWAA